MYEEQYVPACTSDVTDLQFKGILKKTKSAILRAARGQDNVTCMGRRTLHVFLRSWGHKNNIPRTVYNTANDTCPFREHAETAGTTADLNLSCYLLEESQNIWNFVFAWRFCISMSVNATF